MWAGSPSRVRRQAWRGWRWRSRTWQSKGTPSATDVAILFLGNMMALVGLPPTIWATAQVLRRMTAEPEHIAAILLPLLGSLAFAWVGCAVVALVMFALHGKLNRRCVPAILLFPVFLFTWAPINLYAVLTPPPQWKVIKHTRGIERAE